MQAHPSPASSPSGRPCATRSATRKSAAARSSCCTTGSATRRSGSTMCHADRGRRAVRGSDRRRHATRGPDPPWTCSSLLILTESMLDLGAVGLPSMRRRRRPLPLEKVGEGHSSCSGRWGRSAARSATARPLHCRTERSSLGRNGRPPSTGSGRRTLLTRGSALARRAPPREDGHHYSVGHGGEGATTMLVVAGESEGRGGWEGKSGCPRCRSGEWGTRGMEWWRAQGETEGEVRLREG